MPTCSRAYTLNVSDADMPLTDAIYIAPHIYGVRGGYLFEFDANGASTGRKLAFAEAYMGDSYLSKNGSTLYASSWFDPCGADRYPTGRGLYSINTTTMATTTAWNVNGLNSRNSSFDQFQTGPFKHVVLTGGKIVFIMNFSGANGSNTQLVRFDPGTGLCESPTQAQEPGSGGFGVWTFDYGATALSSLVYDSVNDRIWSNYEGGLIFQATPATGDFTNAGLRTALQIPAYVFTNIVPDGTAQANMNVYGFDLCSGNATLYCVLRSTTIYTFPSASSNPADFASFSIAGSRPNAKPRNIKYVAYKNRLYVPTMQDNAVVEINPNTNTVTNVFTGFDLPWSIVDTGSKVFAVQLGSTGLRLVTT